MNTVPEGSEGLLNREIQQKNLPRVVIVEDDAGVAELIEATLAGKADIIMVASRAEDVVLKREGEKGHDVPLGVDVLITDYGLAGRMNGIQLAEIMKKEYRENNLPPPYVIMITGRAGEVKVNALASGINEVIGKPFDVKLFSRRFQEVAKLPKMI